MVHIAAQKALFTEGIDAAQDIDHNQDGNRNKK